MERKEVREGHSLWLGQKERKKASVVQVCHSSEANMVVSPVQCVQTFLSSNTTCDQRHDNCSSRTATIRPFITPLPLLARFLFMFSLVPPSMVPSL